MTMTTLADLLRFRFGDFAQAGDPALDGNEMLRRIAGRGVTRRFEPEPLPAALVETLCALALCAPAKSDLQQRDIVIVEDPAIRGRINTLLAAQDWIPDAPNFLIFCGNNRRQRQIHAWRNRPFANDHIDPFFNAAVDAGIALATFMTAAEAAGVGCCPISVIRDHAAEVSRLLDLPDHVFPVAALGLGWPARAHHVSMRLPLSVTVHRDRYREDGLRETIDAYDRRRAAAQPMRTQRHVAAFGTDPSYGWSEDKARQYATPERADFGAFVRSKGFKLE
jgi:nitroreductase